MTSTNQNIIPKDCSYGCNTRIYWNTAENAYFEVFTKQKHICKNRIHTTNVHSQKPTLTSNEGNTNRPYYSKKPWPQKPKMSNSFELLQGSIAEIQKKYEILSDIVIVEYSGKIHGSQQSRDPKIGLIDLLVYYEVPLGQREEVKRKFANMIRNPMTLQRNNY